MIATHVRRPYRAWSAIAGAGLALVYTLSPLAVCVVAAGAIVVFLFARELPRHERRWFTGLIAAALIARLLAVGGVFVSNLPYHDDQFVGATSGDEAYAMSRAMRTRDILRGSRADKYDFFVAFDEYGRNSYITVLTAAQLVFGPTPYSFRLLNALLFTTGALLLFRLCRGAFGPLPAFGGLFVVLFWPTLFAWSVSLLKEPLYFLAGTVVLTCVIGAVRQSGWRSRVAQVIAATAGAAVAHDMRPGALVLITLGLGAGIGIWVVTASKRAVAIAACALVVATGVVWSLPAVNHRVTAGLEAAAKTQTGHVFTVGHAYKVLDAGFYVNPQTPAASTLTLTPDEAARFVLRALASFLVVPLPWQLQSRRELAFLPEQLAWYGLVLLLPLGIVAGCRRDRYVTGMLVGYVLPTAVALAVTNGNVGTLLRLRGLLIPYLAWVSVIGFCAALQSLGAKNKMPLIDEQGRVLGRVNLLDAGVVAFIVVLIPLAYGTVLLFRTPAPRIGSVQRVPITREERRVAGGARLTAKLKVRGSGLRPMLRASIDDVASLGFVFEDPNFADVLVGEVPPGTHDLILYDGVNEVARLPRSVTIQSEPSARVAGVGTLINLDRVVADALVITPIGPEGPPLGIVRLGPVRRSSEGRWQRAAEVIMSCDPDPGNEGCAIGGVVLASKPLPTVNVTGASGSVLSFALSEILPASAPEMAVARVRFRAPAELLTLARVGDRDECLDARAATILETGNHRPAAGVAELDVVLRLGVDESRDGWTYRTRVIKPGAPFTLVTDRYVLEGTVLSVRKDDVEASR